jgi:hypothetical protein
MDAVLQKEVNVDASTRSTIEPDREAERTILGAIAGGIRAEQEDATPTLRVEELGERVRLFGEHKGVARRTAPVLPAIVYVLFRRCSSV